MPPETPAPAPVPPKPAETPAPAAPAPVTPAPAVPATPPPATPAPAAAATPYESALAAVEAWQANPTPELKTVAEAAVKKAKESQPAARVVPEKYELKLPEGSKLDAKHPEAIAAFAKTRGLTQEDAQALLERDNLALQAQMKKIDDDYKAFVDDLAAKAKADPEIGGANLPVKVANGQQVLARFDKDGGLRKVLDESGYGNHPIVIKFFDRIHAAMKPDELVIPPAQPAPQKDMATKWYPSQAAPTK